MQFNISNQNKSKKCCFKSWFVCSYLSLTGQTYGRPINGQFEIVGVQWPNSNAVNWKASEGLFIHSSDFNAKKQVHIEHTEL